jgi:cyclophilin family peptidyl-prolyl cis-trans isomerase
MQAHSVQRLAAAPLAAAPAARRRPAGRAQRPAIAATTSDREAWTSGMVGPRRARRQWARRAALAAPAPPPASHTHLAPIRPQVDRAAAALRAALVGAAAAALVVGASPPPALAALPTSSPTTNAGALLRNALPISNKPIREVQRPLEQISEDLRVPGKKSLGTVAKRVRVASSQLDRGAAAIAADFAPANKAAGQEALAKLKTGLQQLQAIVDADDKQEVLVKQQELLSYVADAEAAMVGSFPFAVPAEYAALPQLRGRATVDVAVRFAEPRVNGVTGGVMTVVADGYNAPVTAGAWVDLVRRGFYDGMEVQRADGFVVQTGKPKDADGFVGADGKVRTVPFEVMVQGDKVPVYEETLEDNGRFNEQPVLPFNAFGTVALARGEFEPNSGSSQFFFLLKESELTPTGSNLLDGRYAVLGYVTSGAELLKDLQVGDAVVSAKLVAGGENLVEGKQ